MLQRSANRRSLILVAAGLVAAGSWVWQARAWACSLAPPPCIAVPPLGATFPANAVAIRVSRSGPGGWEDILALRTEEGNAVAASIKMLATGEHVFSPDQALEPGRRYVLSYDTSCSGRWITDFAFQTTEPISFPTTAGTLKVIDEGVRVVEHVLDPRTGTNARAAFVKLQLVETADSQPFRALRTYRVEVDDRLPARGRARPRDRDPRPRTRPRPPLHFNAEPETTHLHPAKWEAQRERGGVKRAKPPAVLVRFRSFATVGPEA